MAKLFLCVPFCDRQRRFEQVIDARPASTQAGLRAAAATGIDA